MARSIVLTRELSAVKVKADQPIGPVYRIPASSRVRPLGSASAIRGMIEIEWQDEVYAVFEEDLQARSEPASRWSRFT